jgi:hypothetical protein
MNVEIGTEAAQFPEKEYINGLFVAVSDFEQDVRRPGGWQVEDMMWRTRMFAREERKWRTDPLVYLAML